MICDRCNRDFPKRRRPAESLCGTCIEALRAGVETEVARDRAGRAMTQPLQLRAFRDDFKPEPTPCGPGMHEPEVDRYNVETPSTTRATMRIPRSFLPVEDVDAYYDFIIVEYNQ